MFDTLIRDGKIVDGTGKPAFHGDIGIRDGKIAAIGRDLGAAKREVDAEGLVVSPGWVDVHSHFDGQATWDPLLCPSGQHGVTTTVMGNCGIGFAPVRPRDHEALITIMEGVEDIPGTALSEGLPWTWESFPEYLDTLASMPRAIDVAALLPHSAVRAYVMGTEESIRGAASEAQLAEMRALVRDAVAAGAWGLSTSRTKLHLSADGKPVPGSFVEIDELVTLGHGAKDGGGGMLQLVIDWSADDPKREVDWMVRLARETQLPLSFALVQFEETKAHYRRVLDLLGEARREGLPIHAGVASRPVGMLIDLESKTHPFSHKPSFAALADLPREEKRRRMQDPEFRERVLAEEPVHLSRYWRPKMRDWSNMYLLGDPPNYEPAPEESLAARAAREGRRPEEIAWNAMMANDWLYFPFINYAEKSLSPLLEMMRHEGTVVSLADGGAHCGLICDASAPTYQLGYWTKERTRGPRLGLEEAVHLQAGRTAAMWGFPDRGTLEIGKRADINLVDMDRLRLHPPRWAADLPAGGRRLLQDADGYVATFLAGEQTWANGKPTGARPGGVVRGMKI